MSLKITGSELRSVQLKTRMPFRYGIATMTEFPLVFVRIRMTAEGREVTGTASDLLPPKWFTKLPDKPVLEEISEMLEVIFQALNQSAGLEAETVFELWRQLYRGQERFGQARGFPPLLAHFGTSLVERAVIEAYCRAAGQPFARAVATNSLGIRLGEIHQELQGLEPKDLLPAEPLSRLTARHTVGLGDPLRDEDVPDDEKLTDDLPQSLESCIRRYRLRHFKIKVVGDLAKDAPRLAQIGELARECGIEEASFSVDGNEQFTSIAAFREYWTALEQESWFSWLQERLLFVEQPLHRKVALDEGTGTVLHGWERCPPVIIDESDGDLTTLPKALRLGYRGTSHKNCKGIIKGLVNRCLIENRARRSAERRIMSGEDLCNQGPVALLQDLAVMACLGIESVERNGHHYCAGLSGFDEAVQHETLRAHPDLYHRSRHGWPTLTIENGSVSLDSVNRAPFGVGSNLRYESFPLVPPAKD